MKITQVINNNIVFSSDAEGNEIVVVGKGIGFHGKVGQRIDEGKIAKVFTLKDRSEKEYLVRMGAEIPYEVVTFGLRAADYIAECSTRKIHKGHLILPLIDHIYTTLERYKEGIHLENSVLWNIRYLYKEEYKIASDIADMMVSAFGLPIEDDEASYITLHIVNAELDLDRQDSYKATAIIEAAIAEVEDYFDTVLDRDSVDFTRFVTHLQFFTKRMLQRTFWQDENGGDELDKLLQYQYRRAFECAGRIISTVQKEYGVQISEKERSYLSIHIARLMEGK